ncbi:MAG TPA: multicopper oxidase domain-containing protein [Terriglobales bacterium]|nr:multicopper oxidase domain-containing protein [Terriglobales bacterium]
MSHVARRIDVADHRKRTIRPTRNFVARPIEHVDHTADAVPPEAVEMGWKDTVRADPGMVTRIIVKFEGYAGRHVWHCHILENEDNEMMRPFEVVAR